MYLFFRLKACTFYYAMEEKKSRHNTQKKLQTLKVHK